MTFFHAGSFKLIHNVEIFSRKKEKRRKIPNKKRPISAQTAGFFFPQNIFLFFISENEIFFLFDIVFHLPPAISFTLPTF